MTVREIQETDYAYVEKVYNNGEYIERLLSIDPTDYTLEDLFKILTKTGEGLAGVHFSWEFEPSNHPDYFDEKYVGVGGQPLPGDEEKWKAEFIKQRGY